MDGVVAAPESHRVLFENDAVRVLEVTIAAGDREPEHTHRAPSVMIVDGPARIRYYQGDALTFSSPEDTADSQSSSFRMAIRTTRSTMSTRWRLWRALDSSWPRPIT